MQPVEEMNLEEALDAGLIGTTIKGIAHPDVPSFWPHTEVLHRIVNIFVLGYNSFYTDLGGIQRETFGF